jgi:hypothetical protein
MPVDQIWEGHIQVLQVPSRELLVRNNLNLSVALLADLDCVTEVASAAIDLYTIMKELLESREIENFVVDRLGGIDHELQKSGLAVAPKPPNQEELVRMHNIGGW